jgi:histone H3/H4
MNSATPSTLPRKKNITGACELLKGGFEKHLGRLIRDASTTAKVIRKKSNISELDIANARSRGDPLDLQECLQRCELEATEALPNEFESISDNLLKSFASQEKVLGLRSDAKVALRLSLFKFLSIIYTAACKSATGAKRLRVSTSDVEISLRAIGRGLK